MISEVTNSNISVQWGEVHCIHRNGDITGYSVRYGVVDSDDDPQIIRISNDTREVTITGLMASTLYYIEVAAVHNELIGPYSSALNEFTDGMYVAFKDFLFYNHYYYS